jgi:hypothetical protein
MKIRSAILKLLHGDIQTWRSLLKSKHIQETTVSLLPEALVSVIQILNFAVIIKTSNKAGYSSYKQCCLWVRLCNFQHTNWIMQVLEGPGRLIVWAYITTSRFSAVILNARGLYGDVSHHCTFFVCVGALRRKYKATLSQCRSWHHTNDGYRVMSVK